MVTAARVQVGHGLTAADLRGGWIVAWATLDRPHDRFDGEVWARPQPDSPELWVRLVTDEFEPTPHGDPFPIRFDALDLLEAY